MTNLPDRLKRYSKKAIADALDSDFADAVWKAADEIEDMTYDIDSFNDEITAMFGMNQALLDFAHFVAKEVVVEDDQWSFNAFSFPELACRRLYKLGIIEEADGKWVYEPRIITIGGEDDG
ncbi:MAG: hypothetical protein K6G34_08290 [Lachnospiraceae bacterium]|nr:hypothetical protein [Lachnospiraceae bacterium]